MEKHATYPIICRQQIVIYYITATCCLVPLYFPFNNLLNHLADFLGYLLRPFLKSTYTIPNRTVYPSDHSKLSINDHAKYPFTFTPILHFT